MTKKRSSLHRADTVVTQSRAISIIIYQSKYLSLLYTKVKDSCFTATKNDEIRGAEERKKDFRGQLISCREGERYRKTLQLEMEPLDLELHSQYPTPFQVCMGSLMMNA